MARQGTRKSKPRPQETANAGRLSRPRDRAREQHRAEPPILPPYRPQSRLERWGPGVLIAVVAFLAYIPSFDNKFVSWDDDHYLYNNQQVILVDGIKSCLFDVVKYSDRKFRGIRKELQVSHQFYPLVFGMYWVEFRLYERLVDDPILPDQIVNGIKFDKMNPDVASGYHVTSAIFHSINVLLLIALLRSLGLNTWTASAAAALFALTPVNVATVVWAAERKNILSMMFYMLAMMSYLRFRRGGRWYFYVGCILLHQCALFSKTVAVTFPVMLVLTDRLLDGRWTVSSVIRALPMVVQSGIAAGVTIHVEEERERVIPITQEQRPLVAAAALWFYLYKAFVLIRLLPVYRLWNPSWAQLRWLVAPFGLLLSAWGLWHWRRRIPGHVYWGLAFFVVTTGPMLGFKNINYFQFAFVADHYFYHGGIGLFVAFAVILDALRRRLGSAAGRHAVTALVGVLSVVFAWRTAVRTNDWTDAERFWHVTLAGNPDCWPAYYNLGNQRLRDAKALRSSEDAERREQLLREAIELYKQAVRVKPNLTQAHQQIVGILCEYLKDWPAAEVAAERWVEHVGGSPRANYNFAEILRKRKKFDRALKYYERAAHLDPANYGAYGNMGAVYLRVKKDPEAAIPYLQRAVELRPGYFAAWVDLGRAHFETKRFDLAQQDFEEALRIQPEDVNVKLMLAQFCLANKQFDRAEALCREVLEKQPDHPGARQLLEQCERARGITESKSE